MFKPVPLPGFGADFNSRAVREEIAGWVSSAPMRALLQDYGWNHTPAAELKGELQELCEFAQGHWDFRRGAERKMAWADDGDDREVGGLSASPSADVFRALGFVVPAWPNRAHYDHILILGGLARACILRPAYCAHLLKHGVSGSSIVALTAARVLAPDERKWLMDRGMERATFEHEVLADGVRSAFGTAAFDLGAEDNHISGFNRTSGLLATRRLQTDTDLQLVIAPSTNPSLRRANTADTYQYWAEHVSALGHGERILVITYPIYTPYQHAEAVRCLGTRYSCSVETVGINFASIGDQSSPGYKHHHYLQEMTSTLRSLRDLNQALG